MGCAPFLLPGQRPLADEAARSALEAGWGLAEPIPAEPGLGLEDTFGAALSGRLKAMYVMGANPARSARDREHARRALEALELLVVQDVFLTETAQLADVVLPACSWAEKEGSLTSAERRIQRVNRALAPAGQSRPDWEILVALLEHMGYEGLYNDSDEILTEIARTVPGYEGVTSARLERSGTVVSERPGKVYRAPSPDEIARIGVHWPAGRDGTGTPVLYTESFPRGRAAFIPVPLEEAELGEEVYRDSIEASLYVQGTDTMTGRCPTLASLQRNGAADSSPERGRGVGIVKGPNLSLAAYSTGQLTDI